MAELELWQLFVDESGRFEEEETELSWAGGVLVRERPSPEWQAKLRRFFEEAFPVTPYPPHSCELNRVSSRVIRVLLREKKELPPGYDVCARVAEILCQERPKETEELVELVRKGRKAYRALDSADTWLREYHRAEYAAIETLHEGEIHTLASRLGCLFKSYGPGQCFVVGAACVPRVAWPEVKPEDLYLETLEAVFERIVLLLRANDGVKRTVWVSAATRHVERRECPEPMPLMAAHIGEKAQMALGMPFLVPEKVPFDDRLRFVAEVPQKYDRKVSPGIVLADFVTNRLRQHLKGSWEKVTRRAPFKLRVTATPRGFTWAEPLPALAALGRPREAVGKALGPGVVGMLDIRKPAWPAEQANAWIVALAAALRRGGAA